MKMNDNNKMDRGKEHAGPKKMTPRQKQKRNRKATLAAVLCFVAAIAIVGTYTMRDYKTVKKEGELAKAQLEEQKKALEEASQEASGNAQKDSASESGTDGAGTGGKAEKSGSGAGTTGTASKNAATAGNTDGSGNNGNQASKSRRPGRGKKHSRLYRTADKVLQRGRMQCIYGITKRWNTSKPCRLYDKKIKNVYNWGRSKNEVLLRPQLKEKS